MTLVHFFKNRFSKSTARIKPLMDSSKRHLFSVNYRGLRKESIREGRKGVVLANRNLISSARHVPQSRMQMQMQKGEAVEAN